jgi:type II secretory pathway component GspD/PulD (secretin)/tetratricopeptide (TPR) repeat protein
MRISRKTLLLLPALLLPACADMAESEAANVAPVGPQSSIESTNLSLEPAASSFIQEPGQDLDQQGAAQDVEVRKQKRRLLAGNYVAMADDFFNRGDYQGAAMHYSNAFQLDPESREAREGLRRAQAAMGGTGWTWLDSEGLIEQQSLRWAATRLKIEGLMNDGDRAMARGDATAAEDAYTTAYQTLRISPNVANDSLNLSLIEARRDAAREARISSMEAVRAAETAAAAAEAAAEEDARRVYFENRITALFHEANEHFLNGFYDKSVSTLDKILLLDPSNKDAEHLRGVANESWHQQRQHRTAQQFRENWSETFEGLKMIMVPPKASIEFDLDVWKKAGGRIPLDEVGVETEIDPEIASIKGQLARTEIEARFDNPIEEVAANLASYTNVNFVVSRAVREDLDEDAKQVTFTFNKPMPVSRIMENIEKQSDGQLKFVIRNGAVNVISAEEANSGHVQRQYEVRSIIRRLPDFDLPEITIAGSGGVEFEPEELNEDREANLLSEDTLMTILGVDDWEEPAYAQIQEGTLIVYHQPERQLAIASILAELRKSTNTSVEIRVRFLKVEDSFLQDIGIDFRGLGNQATEGIEGKGSNVGFDDFGTNPAAVLGTDGTAGLYFSEADNNVNILARTENLYDLGLGAGRQRNGSANNSTAQIDDGNTGGLENSGGLSLQWALLDDSEVQLILRAVQKSKRSEVVTEPRLMVYNATRATLTVANQVSYVSDFDVEIAQAASIAAPIVRVVMDGVFLDVLPVVSSDRRSVSIDLRPTVATLRRPIRTFQTSLGSGSPVTIMLPEIELQKIRTRATVPDGGTLLVGGFKIVDQQDMESGIPYLNKIPILSFFFQRQGTYESYRRLVILLTAHIIIPEEHAPDSSAGLAR